jgi:hypothetical protein
MRLFRLMKVDADGKPRVGDRAMALGVRPADPTNPAKRSDVLAATDTEPVRPFEGGLSCYADPADIALAAKQLQLWSIDERDVPPELLVRLTGPGSHHHIEPGDEMPLAEFQQLLADTRDFWQPELQGGQP